MRVSDWEIYQTSFQHPELLPGDVLCFIIGATVKIHIYHHDDICEKNRLNNHFNEINNHPNIKLFFGNCIYYDGIKSTTDKFEVFEGF